jgi:hypothetical protein
MPKLMQNELHVEAEVYVSNELAYRPAEEKEAANA